MILAQLKSATREHHERIERRFPLLNPALDLPMYCRLIERLWGYYKPLEDQLGIHSWAERGYDFDARRKTPLLEADLGRLTAQRSRQRLRLCQDIPDVSSEGFALGCLYVIEGATLGGQVVVRLLRRRLGTGVTSCSAFYQGYGESTREHWEVFCRFLTATVTTPRMAADAISGAGRTFDSLERWLFDSSSRLAR